MKLARTLRDRSRLLQRLVLGEVLARPGEGPLARPGEEPGDGGGPGEPSEQAPMAAPTGGAGAREARGDG